MTHASHLHYRKQWFETHQQIETEACVVTDPNFQGCRDRSLDRFLVTVNLLEAFSTGLRRIEEIKQMLAQFDVNQFEIALLIRSFDIVTELLQQSPLHDSLILTLTHVPRVLWKPSSIELTQRFSFRNNNRITKLKVWDWLTEEQIYCLLDLFLRLEYFEMYCRRGVHRIRLITTLLNHRRVRSPYLQSICLHVQNADDSMARDLRRSLNSDTSVRHVMVHHIRKQIFVQWRED